MVDRKEMSMKKVLVLTICLLLVGAVLVGCGSESTDSTTETSNNSTTTSQGSTQGSNQTELSTCQANLLAIDSAALDYKIRNSGQHPSTVDVLVPNYLDSLPVEPFGGTYSLIKDTSHGDNVKAVCSKGHTY